MQTWTRVGKSPVVEYLVVSRRVQSTISSMVKKPGKDKLDVKSGPGEGGLQPLKDRR